METSNTNTLVVYARRAFVFVGMMSLALSANAQPGAGRNSQGPSLSGPTGPTFSSRLSATGGAQYRAQTGKNVANVKIRGNTTVEESRIWKHIRTRSGRPYDPQILESDVRRLTSVSGLFRNVKTYTQENANGVSVIFEVVERPTITYLKFIGNYRVKDKALIKESGLNIGDALNLYSVQEAKRRLLEFYHTRGFSRTEIRILEGDKSSDRGVVFEVAESNEELIWSVKFIGNQIATDGRLKTVVQSKPGILKHFFGGKVDLNKIDQDVQRLTAYYRSLGYFQARVGRELEYTDDRSWATLTFVIDEGPRYKVRNVSVEGNGVFQSTELVPRLSMQRDAYFHQAEMNRDVREITARYGEKGYYFADIKPDLRFLEEPGQLDLIYQISEGKQYRVGNINVRIEGEFPHTRESVVLSRFSLRPGDLLDTREIERSKRLLVSSQIFEHNPAQGITPKVTVRPRDPTTSTSLANRPTSSRGSTSGTAVRGQSPDPSDIRRLPSTRSYTTSESAAYGQQRQETIQQTNSPQSDSGQRWFSWPQ